MITDMVDLEPLLREYDRDTLLVGPLLGLSLSSSYRYFHIAGQGAKTYHAVGLGFVESEADAERQRADLVQKLQARFAEVVTFVSHPEMARAVYARWPSEETARVLSSAEIATKAASAELPDQAADIAEPPDHGPDAPAMNDFAAAEPNWHFAAAQSATAETPNQDDRVAGALARELFGAAAPERNRDRAPSQDQAAEPHPVPQGRLAVAPVAEPEPAATGDEDALNDAAEADQDQILDKLARELAAHTADKEQPARLPPAAKLSPLTTRQPEPTARQEAPDFGLSEDDLAAAVLKLKSALEPKSVSKSPTEPQRSQPDDAMVVPVGRTPGTTAPIVRFAALAAAILLVAILVLPSIRQRVQQLVSRASLSHEVSVAARSGPAAPAAAPTGLADAANSPLQGDTTATSDAPLPSAPAPEPSTSEPSASASSAPEPSASASSGPQPSASASSAPQPSALQVPAADVTGAADTGQKTPASTLGNMPSAPAAKPAPPTGTRVELADAANLLPQDTANPGSAASLSAAPATAASGPLASTPAAPPAMANSKAANVAATNAPAVSDQHPAAADDPNAAADHPEAETVTKLVNRGMQSLKSGDLESARRSLQRAVAAIPNSAVALPPTGHDAKDAAQATSSTTAKVPPPAIAAAATEPSQPPIARPGPEAGAKSSSPALVARLEASPAAVAAPTPSLSAAPVTQQSTATTAPGGATTPATSPAAPATTAVSRPSRPSTAADVATRDAEPAAVTRPTTPAAAPTATLSPDQGEITTLLKRGQDFLRNGDFASARLLLRRAADAGSAEAALALGTTYDPIVLQELGALGIAPDVARARQWYQKAVDLGASEAQERLAKLAETRQ